MHGFNFVRYCFVVLVVLHCLVILLTLVSFDFVCVRYVCRVFVRGRMSQSFWRQLFLFQGTSP